MMRKPPLAVALVGLFALSACNLDTTRPNESALLASETIDLIPDYANSMTAEIDGGGIGGARLPEGLQLTAEQKAAIHALHEAFRAAHADELAALKDIERQLRDLRRNGGTREQARALLAQAKPILDALAEDFAALQEAIWAVYTPEQRAWIEAHRPKLCGPNGPPQLSQEQVTQIRALREAFQAAVAADLAQLRQIHQQAMAAKQAGATADEVRAILATAQPILARVRAAEQKLHEDIQNVLTAEQRAAWCIVRQHVAPHRGPGGP